MTVQYKYAILLHKINAEESMPMTENFIQGLKETSDYSIGQNCTIYCISLICCHLSNLKIDVDLYFVKSWLFQSSFFSRQRYKTINPGLLYVS